LKNIAHEILFSSWNNQLKSLFSKIFSVPRKILTEGNIDLRQHYNKHEAKK